MSRRSELLAAYDAQLRGHAEVLGALAWDRAGPLWRARFPTSGFVSYEHLDGLTGAALERLVIETRDHFAADPAVESVEWKTRGHDDVPDLHEILVAAGFLPEEVETVMVGEAASLAVDVELPPGVVVRRAAARADLDRAARLQLEVFGRGPSEAELADRVERSEGRSEVWVAESQDGAVRGAGRLEVVPGTDFAGLWGGATDLAWRGRGLYRALTAARARSALERGVRYLHSDCTEMSRPILQRSGLVPVTTTTPYVWDAARPAGR